MEYRLSRPLPSKYVGVRGLGLQAEYNDFQGAGNSVARFGVTFRHRLYAERSWLQWRYFPVETDGDGGQASLIFFAALATCPHQWICGLELDGRSEGPLGVRAAVELPAHRSSRGRARIAPQRL